MTVRLLPSKGTWIVAGFVGLMFATAFTGPIPDLADWQSRIICPAAQDLSYEEYETPAGANAEGVPQTGSGIGFTYHCAGNGSVSGSRTPLVLSLQFVAGTLFAYGIFAIFTLKRYLKLHRGRQLPT